MTAEELFELLAGAPGEEIEAVADRVLASGSHLLVLDGPEVVTVPVRLPVPGTATTTAVVGHAALTTCAVLLDGVRGDGCRPERDLRGALAAAVCDAEVQRGGPLADEVAALARRAGEDRAAVHRERARRASLTRLDGP